MSTTTLFTEDQRMRQWWFILIVGIVAAAAWYVLIEQIIRGNDVGSNSAPDWLVIGLWMLVGMGMPAFFWWFRLETAVDDTGIHLRMAPLSNRTIFADDIERFGARTYKPVREYGGWGIRGFGSNRAYNVSGDRGVQLELKNGDRVLIGTQHPTELEDSIAILTGNGPEYDQE